MTLANRKPVLFPALPASHHRVDPRERREGEPSTAVGFEGGKGQAVFTESCSCCLCYGVIVLVRACGVICDVCACAVHVKRIELRPTRPAVVRQLEPC